MTEWHTPTEAARMLEQAAAADRQRAMLTAEPAHTAHATHPPPCRVLGAIVRAMLLVTGIASCAAGVFCCSLAAWSWRDAALTAVGSALAFWGALIMYAAIMMKSGPGSGAAHNL